MEEFGKSGGVIHAPATCLPGHVPKTDPSVGTELTEEFGYEEVKSDLRPASTCRPKAGGESEPPTPLPSPTRASATSPRSSCPPVLQQMETGVNPICCRSRLGVLVLKSESPGRAVGLENLTRTEKS